MGRSKIIFGNQVLQDLTMDTITPNVLLNGYTAHGSDGEAITGNCTFTVDASNATASADEILAGQTAGVGNVMIEGQMPNRGAVSGYISDVNVPYSVQRGFHDGSGTVGIDSTEAAKLVPESIKLGINILGVEGNYAGEPANVCAVNVTPYTTNQTILPPPGYDYISQVNVAPIYYSESPAAQGGGNVVTIGMVAPTS